VPERLGPIVSWIRFAGLALLTIALPPQTASAQYGAVGLSTVGSTVRGNENLIFYVPEAGDHFAAALAAGDFNGDGADDLATSIPDDDNLGGARPDSGIVILRYGAPGAGLASGLAQTVLSEITGGSPNPAENGDQFGWALAACNFDGDAFDDLAVGVPHDRVDGVGQAGGVAVYFGAVNGIGAFPGQYFTQNTAGIPGDAEEADHFGFAVACGDVNGDGFDDLAIGVPDETFESVFGDEFSAGTVAVILGSEDGLDPSTARSVNEDIFGGASQEPTCGDRFGAALAIGDLYSDGQEDLIVGAPGENNGDGCLPTLGRGQILILDGSSASWSSAVFYTESNFGGVPEAGDQFGSTLATGDFDGNLFADLAIGQPFEDFDGAAVADAGQVTVALFRNGPPVLQFWLQNNIFGFGTTQAGDWFGFALGVGDFDGDGRDDLAMGAPGDVVAGTREGTASVIMGSPAGLTAARLRAIARGREGFPGPAGQADRSFAQALATGDWNGDGHSDLVVGAPYSDVGGLADVGDELVLYGSLFSDGFELQTTGFWSASVP
jgi:hypothetical protein